MKGRTYMLRLPRWFVVLVVVSFALTVLLEVGWRISVERKLERRANKPGAARTATEFHLANGRITGPRRGAIAQVHHPYLVVHPGRGSMPADMDIGPDGFRGGPWEPDKPAGTLRIVVTGGSAAFGFGAERNDHTIPALLQTRLNAATGGSPRFEVLNAGAVGYVATQELVLFATELAAYEPDLLIAYNGWNDFELARAAPADRPLWPSTFWGFDELAEESHDIGTRLIGWTEIYRGLQRRQLREQADEVTAERHGTRLIDALHPDALPLYRSSLTQLVRLARGNDCEVILCVQPEIYSQADFADEAAVERADPTSRANAARLYPSMRRTARAVAAEEGAAYVDAQRALLGAGHAEVFRDTVHLTDAGNERVATYLVPTILDRLGIRPKDGR